MKVSDLIQQLQSRRLIYLLLVIVLVINTACSSLPPDSGTSLTEKVSRAIEVKLKGEKLREVAPPPVIQELSHTLDQYAPQVAILSPENDRIYSESSVDVKLQVQNLPIFKDEQLNLGPHLELFVDNEFYRSVYDTDEPISLDNLSPGTHTLRVFAVRPWQESYKNDGAYAQKTFHIIGKTDANTPDASLPLLTYNQPRGTYGAEPILLDFYLTNAPLHIVANADESDRFADWRIKVTINGESFLLDSWQPVYLKGFSPGANWIQLEFIDDKGEKIDNVFNTTIQVIKYDPEYQDTLSQITKGELTASAALPIADMNARNTTPIETIPPLETTEEPKTEPEEESNDVINQPESASLEEPTENPEITPEPEIKAEEPIILEEIPDLILPETDEVKNIPILEPIPDVILPQESETITPAPGNNPR